MNEQVMPRVNGVTFRCEDCGCNVFTEYAPYLYRCNGCGSRYSGEPRIELKQNDDLTEMDR